MSDVFSPIAIVGQGCVLPGAFTPQALWENVAAKRDLVTKVPEGRWKMQTSEVVAPQGEAVDTTPSCAGSYVTDFENVFDANGFAIDGTEITRFDPMASWLCHAGRDALRSAGLGAPVDDPHSRMSLIVGNLSFPTESMAAWGEASYHRRFGLNAEAFWSQLNAEELQAQREPLQRALAAPDGIHRFMSGLPAQLVARALGLRGSAFCLDAACASSLYAISLATDWLHQKRADVVLAGAVNRADSLFLHMGFGALQALSPSGRSRPFHSEADGLVPGEGAGLVALMRLEDAIAQNRPIAGVIRGIGLSNDGRAKNLLAPSSAGQVRAMRTAYAQAGWQPGSVSLVECHATGTPTGDGTELASMAEIFAGVREGQVAIGSLKSNLGHLITTAGVAGLQKVLGALAHQALPPTLHVEMPHPKLSEPRSPFRTVNELSDWSVRKDQPRRAAVSAFGFGGNNAHLLVEEWSGTAHGSNTKYRSSHARKEIESQMSLPGMSASTQGTDPDAPGDDLAIVAIGARSGAGCGQNDFFGQVFGATPCASLAERVQLRVDGLRFPPNDLKDALPQQVLLFEAAREAMGTLVAPPDEERFAILVGMQCDVDVTTPGIRWRMPQRSASLSRVNGDSAPHKAWRNWGRAQKDEIAPPLSAARVLGQMPNIPANRLNLQLDCRGPGFTVSAEEVSGISALDVACTWLRSGVIDCALVGAVDVCGDARHQEAMRDLLGADCPKAADAAIVLVLKRTADARAAGERVIAHVTSIHQRMSQAATGDAGSEKTAVAGLVIETSAMPAGPRPAEHRVHSTGEPSDAPTAETTRATWRLADQIGHAHAASGLLGVAVAALACARGAYPRHTQHVRASLESGPTFVRVETRSIGGALAEVGVRKASPPTHEVPSPRADAAAADASNHPGDRVPNIVEMPAVRRFSPLKPPHFSRSPASQHLPATNTTMSAPLTAPQFMEPAPALPPIFPRGKEAPLPTEPLAAPMAPMVPVSAVASSLPSPTAASAVHATPAHALLRARDEMTRAHQAFLEAQGAAQQAFLALQQRHAERLRALATQPAAYPLPAPPLPSPTPTQSPKREAYSDVSTSNLVATRAPIATDASADRGSVLSEQAEPTPESKASAAYVSPPPLWSRRDLETLAAGRISDVFGPLFQKQDGFSRQVRMPTPPLLLCDRVMSIDAEPGKLRPHTTIRTETDVTRSAWYLHEGRMPPGVLIEAGQADLLLISYMGVDFENRGERVYRLLGCDLTYHAPLPEVGSLLHFDIHIDGFATHGDTRIFFFHSDCRIGGPEGERVLSVRNGQAGFFTDEELAHSGGILWTPEQEEPALSSRPLCAPAVASSKNAYSREDLEAWAGGDAYTCFGPGFELSQTHVATPRIADGDMLLMDRVTQLDSSGGPWQRGYLRAELDLHPDRWFFQGHFKDDPCMPGTMMFEGCLETLSLYLASQGHTLRKDGWRFEPLHGELFALRCRGQATPTSKRLVYEVFVKEIVGGDRPRIVADILATVDGLKALHCKDVGVQLVPDWPLARHPELLGEIEKPSGWDAVGGVRLKRNLAPAAAMAETVVFDQDSLLATAWGKPSDAFGDMYQPFDDGRRVPRLPGPPYHFMSRVVHLDGPPQGVMKAGGCVQVEYDVPPDAWYFSQGPSGTMPFAVLLEVALQPCGWLSSYVGSALTSTDELCYRNLDGRGQVHRHITPRVGTLQTTTTLTKVSQSAGMIIQEFALQVHAGEELVFDATTAFGFFPPAALERQVGLVPTDEEKKYFLQSCESLEDSHPLPLELADEPERYFGAGVRLPAPMLRMIDRITGYRPKGGKSEQGWVRAEKCVDPGEWFFRAHFFTDPVQPGSLGLEAMVQTLQWWMLHRGMGRNIEDAVFEPIAQHHELVWRYRGQVVPTNGKIEVELHIIRANEDDVAGCAQAEAEAWLWVDGLRIYRADLGMRMVGRAKMP